MLRRVAAMSGVAVVLLALGVAAAAPATERRRPPASFHVRLKLPQPGDIAVVRIVVRARPRARLPARLRARVANLGQLSPTIAAAGAIVRVRRTRFGRRKFVALVVIVNRTERKPSSDGAQEDSELDLDFQAGGLGQTRIDTANNLLSSSSAPAGLQALFKSADEAPPATDVTKDKEFSADTYGDGGVSGWTPSALVRNGVDAAQAAQNCNAHNLEQAKEKVKAMLKTDLVASERKCQLARSTFAGLKLSFGGPPRADGSRTTYTASNISGSVCGDAATATWAITYSYTGAGSVRTSARFGTANPYTIRTPSFDFGSKIAIRLRYVSGTPPKMRVDGVPSGKVANVKVSPSEVAVKATPVESC